MGEGRKKLFHLSNSVVIVLHRQRPKARERERRRNKQASVDPSGVECCLLPRPCGWGWRGRMEKGGRWKERKKAATIIFSFPSLLALRHSSPPFTWRPSFAPVSLLSPSLTLLTLHQNCQLSPSGAHQRELLPPSLPILRHQMRSSLPPPSDHHFSSHHLEGDPDRICIFPHQRRRLRQQFSVLSLPTRKFLFPPSSHSVRVEALLHLLLLEEHTQPALP